MVRYISSDWIVAAIDNDFGIDNSDWIPRVGEWIAACLGELGMTTQMDMKTVQIYTPDRIIHLPCDFNKLVGIYSSRGCIITKYNPANHKRYNYNGSSSVDYISVYDLTRIKKTVAYDAEGNIIRRRLEYVPGCEDHSSYSACPNLHWINAGNNALELTGDEDYVWLTYTANATDENGWVLVPDLPFVKEAIKWYVLWKILGRGTKHIVYSLTGRNDTNPQWLFREYYYAKAKAEYRNQSSTDEDKTTLSDAWSSSFYLTMKKFL